MNTYTIHPAAPAPSLEPNWEEPAWAAAETLEITHFRPESSAHHPRTFARLLHASEGLHGIFRVEDRYVRCLGTRYFDPVWQDSCVEFFVQPKPGRGYFNFEFNCGGAFLCSHIINPERTPEGFKEFVKVPWELGRSIQVRSSLPERVEPERSEPTIWTLRFFIPLALLEQYLGRLGPLGGQRWRGNFYKCAEQNSHPHWGAWSPVAALNFHLPGCFGELRF